MKHTLELPITGDATYAVAEATQPATTALRSIVNLFLKFGKGRHSREKEVIMP